MRISIVTASFASEATIAETIQSIDSQTHADWRHLILDGDSGDDTVALCGRYSDSRRLVVSERDNGVYDAMNKGIKKADGDIIGFLNADDFYESDDVLATVAEAFEDPRVDLVYGNLRYVEAEDTSKVVRDWKSESYSKGKFRRGWMPPHPTVYARREVFERFGGFDETFDICADWEWLYRVIEVGEIQTLQIDKYMVRMRLGGVSNSSIRNVLRSNRQAMRAFRKHETVVPVLFFPGKILHRLRQFV